MKLPVVSVIFILMIISFENDTQAQFVPIVKLTFSVSLCIMCSAGLDLVAAFYGCLYAGCIPITVRPPHPQNISTTLPTVKMIVEVSKL